MFAKSKPETETADASNQPRARTVRPQTSAAPSIIGTDVRIVGNVTTAGELQLDGIVEGDINCGALTMGEHGTLTGSLSADKVIIRGRVDGKIRGRSVRLEKSSKVSGDVWHESLAIEAGAHVEGKFIHADNPMSSVKKKPEGTQIAPKPASPTNGNNTVAAKPVGTGGPSTPRD